MIKINTKFDRKSPLRWKLPVTTNIHYWKGANTTPNIPPFNSWKQYLWTLVDPVFHYLDSDRVVVV